MSNGAYEGNTGVYRPTADEGAWVDLLCARGLATAVDCEDNYMLTADGVRRAILVFRASPQYEVFSTVRPNVAIQDYTARELFICLERAGWIWTRCATNHKTLPVGYYPGAPKVWCSTRIIPRGYLQCLLQADQHFRAGLELVPHGFQSDAVYRKLSNGNYDLPALGSKRKFAAISDTQIFNDDASIIHSADRGCCGARRSA